MPLTSTFNLQWYGEASAAAVLVTAPTSAAGIEGYARAGATFSATAAITNADATRLVNRPCTIAAVAAVTSALPKGRARPTATIKVNDLSQDDVTGAVLEGKVEGSLSLKEALRLLLAVAVGKTDITDLGGGDATVKFRDLADTKDRVTADMVGSERTSVTRDPT